MAATGVIFLVCLSLPSSLRYRLENIFIVSIIPGPREPDVNQIDSILKPLVDDLLVGWTSGFQLRPVGEELSTFRLAIFTAVCDLHAVRKLAGLGSHAAKYFCSFCWHRKTNINDFAYWDWERRTSEQHSRLAERYRQAGTHKARSAGL